MVNDVWQVTQLAAVVMCGVGFLTSAPLRIAVVPLWQSRHVVETSACSVAPKTTGLNDVKLVWQALQLTEAGNGICVTIAFAVPLAETPLWQDTQVAVPILAWLKVVTHVVNDVWHCEQSANVVI